VPIIGVTFVILSVFLDLQNPKTPMWEGLNAVDWIGSLLIIGATLLTLIGLQFGGVIFSWNSATVLCLIIIGVTVVGAFAFYEYRFARYPIMPSRMFQDNSNIAIFALDFAHAFVLVAATYYMPVYFQSVLGASPILSGVYLLPLCVSMSLTAVFNGGIMKKTGKYLPSIWIGMVLMTLGFGLFLDLEASANWAKIILFLIIGGVGTGLNFQSPMLALQASVAPNDMAAATATFGFIRSLSSAISVIIGDVVIQNEMARRRATLVTALGPQLANVFSGGLASASIGLIGTLEPNQQVIVRKAYFESLRTMWAMVCSYDFFQYTFQAQNIRAWC
jgi:hypothetical protein